MSVSTTPGLTSTQRYYQQQYETLKAQVRSLRDQRDILLGRGIPSSSITDQLHVVTQQLASSENELFNLPGNLHRQIDARTALVTQQLQGLGSNASPSQRASLEGSVRALNEAQLDLSGITGSWERPPAQAYQVGGVIYRNTGVPAEYNFFTTDGFARGTSSTIDSIAIKINNTLQSLEAKDFVLSEQTSQAACSAFVNAMVGKAVTGIFKSPAQFPGVHPALQDEFWGQVVDGGVQSSGGVCKFIYPANQWKEQLLRLGIPIDGTDLENFSGVVSFEISTDIVRQTLAEQNGLAAVSAARAQGNTSEAYLVAAYDDGYHDSLTASDVGFAINQNITWQAWAQTLEKRQAAGLDTSSDLDWLGLSDLPTQTLGNLVQNIETGTVSSNDLDDSLSNLSSTTPTASQNLFNGLTAANDALSLIKAIQSGQPLPIAASGLRLAVDLNTLGNGAVIPNLSAASNIAGSMLSLYSLNQALKNGDTFGAVVSGAQAISLGASAYANVLGYTGTTTANGTTTALQDALAQGEFGQAGAAIQGISEALPYLSIINSIVNGDVKGAIIGVIALIPVYGQVIALFLTIADAIFGGDDDPPRAWGAGHIDWSAGSAIVSATGENGGQEQVKSALQDLLGNLQHIADNANAENPDFAFGIIPNRMPTLDWRDYQYSDAGWRMADINPITGEERAPGVRYDNTWHAVNAEPGSPQQYQDLGTRFIYSAVERGAIAPWWEVQTARIQTAIGDPRAGLTEEERAARNGQMAGPLPTAPGSTQIFRPVALDLNGDGFINSTTQANGVSFNVDDSGYFKDSAWVAPQDGFLFLDRNFNGVVDEGKELFNNGAVDISARGLNGLNWVDADQDGDIDTSDPVFGQLKVWQDSNQNGIEDTLTVNGTIVGHPELKSLSSLGITRLNYRMGTYEQNGQLKLMASPDLVADVDGQIVTPIQGGLLVKNSNGQTSIIVTQLSPSSRLDVGADQINNQYEDITVLVSPGDLLANDSVGGLTGNDPNNGLQVTEVFNSRHGIVSLDQNGFVRFVPEANYSGVDAGFEYRVTAPTGQTTTTFVDINLQNVNDAPTATVDQHLRYIYGYSYYTQTGDWESGFQTVPTNPQYEPYYGMDYLSGTTGWHTTVQQTEDLDGNHNGSMLISDVDDNNGFTYEIVGQSAFGSASIDANGNWHYTNWGAPNMAGEQWSQGGGDESNPAYQYDSTGYDGRLDPFLVKVTDPHGASTTVQVNVQHVGEYYPNYGTGGGGKKPIAIDMDGNGFKFTDVDDSNVFVDINKDGWRHRMAWIGSGDGLLAYDANGNGKIDSAIEFSFASYKHGAQTDLEGLQAFDSNHDALFSAADDKWAKFGVWRDANQNGVTDAGEYQTLNELGIASMSLASDGQFQVVDGQTVHGMGTVTMEDGSTRQLADVTLKYSNEVLLTLPDGTTRVINKPEFNINPVEVNGTADNDLLLGTAGNTIFKADAGDDVIFDDGGNDMVDGGDGNDQIYTGGDNDVVLAGAGDDVVFAGLGNDIAIGDDGNDVLMMEGGNDIAFGGDGNDFISGGTGNDLLSGDRGDDQVFGEQGRDALFGADGNDQLFGLDDDDMLNGGAGNDLLDGGLGADAMNGGSGDDEYVIDNAADTVVENAEEGIDTVTAYIDYVLGNNLENMTLAGSAANGVGNTVDNVLIGNVNANSLTGGAGSDRLDGGMGADTLIGGTDNDTYVVDNVGDVVVENVNEGFDTVRSSISYTLGANVENLTLTGTAMLNGTGNALDNILTGNASNNVLDGEQGADRMAGGRGNDTYYVDSLGDQVIELVAEGSDTVVSSLTSTTLAANIETLVLGSSAGTQAVYGTGNELNNLLVGNANDNVLDGGSGSDTMAGGTGDDSYIVDNVGDIVVEAADQGIDTVQSSVTYALSDNVENIVLTGTADVNAIGNILDNNLNGNAGNNMLDGGAGADTMAGGAGDDSYIVDSVVDVVIEQADAGIDTMQSSVTYSLSDNVENMVLTGAADSNGTGNALDNTLTGNSGSNVLDGGAGADTMVGVEGNDNYIVDNVVDVVVEATDQGIDTVQSSVTYTLSDNIENMMLTGAENVNATGNTMSNNLTGNIGDNVLDGGAGADTMAGAAGNDSYIVDNVSDVVIEQADAGIDTVQSSVTYSLSDNVENMVLTGTADSNGTGNALDNTLTGNSGSNVLDGGAGADTMAGASGNDSYIVDNASDVVIEQADAGIDTVQSSVTYTLSDNIENMVLTGTADVHATGNTMSNNLLGNIGNNVLDGGAGADTMAGAAGNDNYIVDNLDDVIVEAADQGIDTVQSSVTYTLSDHVENMVLTGMADVNAIGNILDNNLSGNAGNNMLDGGADADTMAGGAGDDSYIVDNVGDVVVEAADQGIDTVQSSVTYTLSDNVENMVLTGAENLNATGNTMSNNLLGNIGNNMLDGGAGADTMAGAAGNDSYIVDNVADVVSEQFDAGIDIIYSNVSYVLPEHVENLILTGNGDIGSGGNSANNTLIGNSGNNFISGGAGNDILDGVAGNDTLDGGEGNDVLIGGAGDDFLFGGIGSDQLDGGAGNDAYQINLQDGLDRIDDVSGNDKVIFGTGLSLSNVALRVISTSGVYTAQVRVLNAGGCEQAEQGIDFTVTKDNAGHYVSPIEQFQFADGSINTFDDLLIKTRVTYGSSLPFTITTGRDDDIIYGGPKNNVIHSGSGHDIVYAGSGADVIFGEGGDDYLQGSTGNDTLDGGCGTDILNGGNGQDTLRDSGGGNIFLGGSQDDRIEGGDGNDFIAGGKNNDTIFTGGGTNVVAFTAEDGRDTIFSSAGAINILSLGGEIEYEDLVFAKSGNDLLLKLGDDDDEDDAITFKNWYANPVNRTFVTLQVISEVDDDEDCNATGVNKQKVEAFNFLALVDKFDQARIAKPTVNNWNLMNGLLDAHLEGSNDAAIGGDLAYHYASKESLSGMNLSAAQNSLKDPQFGSGAQTIHPWSTLSNEVVRL